MLSKKAILYGAIFGLLAPYIGIFFGLQISTIVGNILAFPVIGLVYLTGQPFGMWQPGQMVVALLLSIAAWALIFALVAMLLRPAQTRNT